MNNREAKRKRLREDLSRDDMLFLLSVLEGELQARDEVIAVLKTQKTDSALLKARYGFIGLDEALRSLHGDWLRWQQEDYLEDMWKTATAESRKRSNERREELLEVSNARRDAVSRNEERPRNHWDFVRKYKYVIALLEEDRERLVRTGLHKTHSQKKK
ncbi:filamin A-interacting protein 1-like [Syngnathus scovelli]|uniref:filamin A-interacting protein 1-like n=1 Tax=Syngnathus scovelli TaxID=161590 RepID=UPI00210F4389|nr:filamin A-interacting protein 1-like isoform X2 [Syngnathus scovelli]